MCIQSLSVLFFFLDQFRHRHVDECREDWLRVGRADDEDANLEHRISQSAIVISDSAARFGATAPNWHFFTQQLLL